MKKPIITVIGSLNMDLVTTSERMPEQGETITGQSFSTFPGGKGANQAVAAARLGAEVYMIGKVGEDLFGSRLKSILQKEGVFEELVETVDTETGTASITISENDNRIIVVPGANKEVTAEWVVFHEEQIKKSTLLILQLEIPLDSVLKACELAAKHGVTVLLNPAPYQKLPKKLIEQVTYITPNEHEYKQLMDEAAKGEKELFMGKCIVTKGEEGVEFLSENKRMTVDALTVEVIDTTGAGDTFNGALAVALSQQTPLKKAVQFASISASLSVTKMGA